MTTCDRFAPDLVAYLDHELFGARLGYIEAHIQFCPVCQARLRAMRDNQRLLQEHTPLYDDPRARARVKERIQQEALRPQRPWLTRSLAVVAILVLVSAALLLGPPSRTAAGFPLARFLHHFGPQNLPPPSLQSLNQPAPTDQTDQAELAHLSFSAVIPTDLPGDLVLSQRASDQPSVIHLTYHGPNYLVLRLTEMSAADADAEDSDNAQRAVVDGTEILWELNQRRQEVYRVTWLRKGVFFSIQVMESETIGIPQDRMRAIVMQVMTTQDSQ